MNTADGQSLETILDESAQAFTEAIIRVPRQLASRRPNAKCWSLLEIIEHVLLVERMFSAYIAGVEPIAEPVFDAERAAALNTGIASRAKRIEAPAPTRPQGRFNDRDEALSEFNKTGRQVKTVLSKKEAVLRNLPINHPVLGVISGNEAFLVIASHRRRHVEQIDEYYPSC